MHASLTIAAEDDLGRERLCRYGPRPPFSLSRFRIQRDGRVSYRVKKSSRRISRCRIMTPVECIARLCALVPPPRYPLTRFHGVLAPRAKLRCASVPPPRFHTVRYAGVLASASKLRPHILPEPAQGLPDAEQEGRAAKPRRSSCPYRPWAELMMRTFSLDVLCCPRCKGRLRLLALMTDAKEVRRYLRALGEGTEAPERSPARGPPYWRSRALRRRAGDVNAA